MSRPLAQRPAHPWAFGQRHTPPRRWAGWLFLLALAHPAIAGAQADDEAAREAALFGAPAPTPSPAAPPPATPPPAAASPTNGAPVDVGPADGGPAADPEAAREAALFGDPAPNAGTSAPGGATPAAGPRPEASREDALFGPAAGAAPAAGVTPTVTAPPPRPDFARTLTVGGRLWLRTDAYLFDDTALAEQTLQMPNLLDVYLDARPADRVRAYARFRLTYNPMGTDDPAPGDLYATPLTQWQIDQLWLKWDWDRRAFFTVGAQPVRWGTGRLWNPTDVLNRSRLNPLTPIDFRTGVPIARVRLPVELIGGAVELIGDLGDAQALGDVGAAARVQWVLGPTEWSVSGRYRRDQPLMLGVDGSAGLGPFDLYAEAALLHGGHPQRWTGRYQLPSDAAIASGPADALAELQIPTAVDRDDDWIPQAVVGVEYPIQYSDQDSVILGAEYFYNDAGYSDAALYPWLLTTGDFQPFYLGRHAAAAFVVLAAPGDWDDTSFVLTALANLSDLTGVARLNISHTVHRYLFVEPYVSVPFGEAGGAYRFAYTVSDAQAGWLKDLGQPLPFEGGLTIPPSVLQVGLWLRVML